MTIRRLLPTLLVVLLAVGLAPGCKGKGETDETPTQDQLKQQMTAIEQAYAGLLKTRRELEPARDELATIEAVADDQRTPEQRERLAALKATIAPLDAAYEDLQTRLADFLTLGINDFPTSAETKAGLRIYAEEAMVNASERVTRAGDYKKAIDELQTAKGYFEAASLPVHQPLLDLEARFEDLRFITQERFDQIKKGMTRDDVRGIAGTPYYRNVSDIPDRKVIRWLYPKRDGGAAAVYFKMDTGKVYETTFDAVKTQVVAGG